MLHFWQAHWNWWYILSVAGLALAYALGYHCYGKNQKTGRMRQLRTGYRAAFTVLADIGLTLCVLAESHAGIVHLLSGGKTAEQATKDGSAVAITAGAFVGVIVVYGLALVAFTCLGEVQKQKYLKRRRAARKAAKAAAEAEHMADQPKLTVIESDSIFVKSLVFDLCPEPRSTKGRNEPVHLHIVGIDKEAAG